MIFSPSPYERIVPAAAMTDSSSTGHGSRVTGHGSRVTGHLSLISNSPAAARNLEESPLPTVGGSDFSDALDRWEFSLSDAETRRRNACTPEPARETQHFPDIAAHPTARNTQDRPSPRAGRVQRISPEQVSPVPANSRIRTRSC